MLRKHDDDDVDVYNIFLGIKGLNIVTKQAIKNTMFYI